MKPLPPSFSSSLLASWHYEEGKNRVEIDTTHTGQLLHWANDGKTWLEPDPAGRHESGTSTSAQE